MVSRSPVKESSFVSLTRPYGFALLVEGHPNRKNVGILLYLVARTTVDAVTGPESAPLMRVICAAKQPGLRQGSCTPRAVEPGRKWPQRIS